MCESCVEGRVEEKQKKTKNKEVNFIELPVIYLIFVFIMFHLLYQIVSASGLAESMRAFNIIQCVNHIVR